MKKQLKILNLIDIPWNSALTAYAVEQAQALRKKGHIIYFGTVKDTLCHETIKKNNFQTIDIPSRKNNFILPALMELRKFIISKHIDIINAHTGKTQTMAFMLSLMGGKNFKLIRTKTDAKTPKIGFTFKRVKKIITGSQAIEKSYISAGLNPDKIQTVYQGIPKQEPIFLSSFPAWRVGILARLDPVKGHKYFLDAASIILKKRKDVKFIIAGAEANIKFQNLKKYAQELKIDKHLEYAGFVEEPIKFIRSCHIGIIASIGSEVVSRALLEWMSCAKAVIATDVGCVPEMLGKNYLVPPKNSALMAEKIMNFLDNKETIESAGRENKKITEKKYNLENFERETEEVFLGI
ncbi:MAG: glycosyltransferase family 4 protein [Elusimicrobiales bacterium]|nr:glycosyltransferase family 4 protein [Elusimicrobiales bacterium]